VRKLFPDTSTKRKRVNLDPMELTLSLALRACMRTRKLNLQASLVLVPQMLDRSSRCDFETWFVAVLAFGHDPGIRLGRPVEGVSDLIPFSDKLVEPGLHMIQIV
jgi:hypothetical protein